MWRNQLWQWLEEDVVNQCLKFASARVFWYQVINMQPAYLSRSRLGRPAWVVPNQAGSQDPSLNGRRSFPSSSTLSHGLQTTWGENCLSNLNYYHLLAPTHVGLAWFNNSKQSGKALLKREATRPTTVCTLNYSSLTMTRMRFLAAVAGRFSK